MQGSKRITRALVAALMVTVLAGASRVEAHPVEKYAWMFPNFLSKPCVMEAGVDFFSWQRYRETFIGVPPEEYASLFDSIFYNEIYKEKLGVDGNCYGMVLLSLLINDKGGHLGYCAPVSAYSGDTVGKFKKPINEGNPEDPERPGSKLYHECETDGRQERGPTDPFLRRAFEEMMGHQLHLPSVSYTLELLGKNMNTADDAYTLVEAHKPCIVNITKKSGFDAFESGHTVLAYDAKDMGNGEKRIFVYDPNRSWGIETHRVWYTGGPGADPNDPTDDVVPQNFITIQNGDWTFDKGDEIWPEDSQGNIFIIPLSIAGPKARNPASLEGQIPDLLNKILVFGADSSLVQVRDDNGRRFFTPAQRQLETDPQLGLLDMLPFIPTDGIGGGASGNAKEVYFVLDAQGGSRDYHVRGQSGEGYEMTLTSRLGTLFVKSQGGRGSDRVRVERLGTATPVVTLFNDSGAAAYDLEVVQTLRRDGSYRAFRLSRVGLARGALVEVQVAADGEGVQVTSPIQALEFDLELMAGGEEGEGEVHVEEIVLEAGATGLIRPADWSRLGSTDLLGGASRLTPSQMERFENLLGGSSGAPVGPDFDATRDIGSATGGSTVHEEATGVYQQLGGGTGIGGDPDGGDSLQLAYTELSGDFEITVEIVGGIDPRSDAAACSLMARRDIGSASRMSALEVPLSEAAERSPRWVYRAIHGEAEALDESQMLPFDGTRPRFLKMVRRGRVFYGFTSPDGERWLAAGADTWHDHPDGAPVLVGFGSATGGEVAGLQSVVQFRVLQMGLIQPGLAAPLPHDGRGDAVAVLEESFEGRDGSSPADFESFRGAGEFVPQLRDGRLRMSEEGIVGTATAAFSRHVIGDIEAAVHRFDFDLFLSSSDPGGAGDGITFVIASGDTAPGVGAPGSGLGYEGIGRGTSGGADGSPDRRNSIAIEFDTFADSTVGEGAVDESSGYHVGVDVQGHTASVVWRSEDLPDIRAAEGIHVTVVYNRGRVTVFLGGDATGASRGTPVLEIELLPLSFGIPDASAVIGFTASTGESASQTAEIDDLVVSVLDCDDTPEVAVVLGVPDEPAAVGAIVTLDGSGSHAGEGDAEDGPVDYLWDVVAGGARIEGLDFGPTVNVRTVDEGEVTLRLTVDDGHCDNPASLEITFLVGEPPSRLFVRGDCDGDGATRGVADALHILSVNFIGGVNVPCRAACDVNGDGATGGVGDALELLSHNFIGGVEIAAPFPACGPAELASDELLGCERTPRGCQ